MCQLFKHHPQMFAILLKPSHFSRSSKTLSKKVGSSFHICHISAPTQNPTKTQTPREPERHRSATPWLWMKGQLGYRGREGREGREARPEARSRSRKGREGSGPWTMGRGGKSRSAHQPQLFTWTLILNIRICQIKLKNLVGLYISSLFWSSNICFF